MVIHNRTQQEAQAGPGSLLKTDNQGSSFLEQTLNLKIPPIYFHLKPSSPPWAMI